MYLLVLIGAARIMKYDKINLIEVKDFLHYLHVDQDKYNDIMSVLNQSNGDDEISIRYCCETICNSDCLVWLNDIERIIEERVLGHSDFEAIRQRVINIESIKIYKDNHEKTLPPENICDSINHYFTGKPSKYHFDYSPSDNDTPDTLLDYYRIVFNIPKPQPIHNHIDHHDLLDHLELDRNEELSKRFPKIKQSYYRKEEQAACFRSSNRSKFSVSASQSQSQSQSESQSSSVPVSPVIQYTSLNQTSSDLNVKEEKKEIQIYKFNNPAKIYPSIKDDNNYT